MLDRECETDLDAKDEAVRLITLLHADWVVLPDHPGECRAATLTY